MKFDWLEQKCHAAKISAKPGSKAKAHGESACPVRGVICQFLGRIGRWGADCRRSQLVDSQHCQLRKEAEKLADS
jgi:hypothetical protein